MAIALFQAQFRRSARAEGDRGDFCHTLRQQLWPAAGSLGTMNRPEELSDMVRCLSASSYAGTDRHSAPRARCSVSARIVSRFLSLKAPSRCPCWARCAPLLLQSAPPLELEHPSLNRYNYPHLFADITMTSVNSLTGLSVFVTGAGSGTYSCSACCTACANLSYIPFHAFATRLVLHLADRDTQATESCRTAPAKRVLPLYTLTNPAASYLLDSS